MYCRTLGPMIVMAAILATCCCSPQPSSTLVGSPCLQAELRSPANATIWKQQISGEPLQAALRVANPYPAAPPPPPPSEPRRLRQGPAGALRAHLRPALLHAAQWQLPLVPCLAAAAGDTALLRSLWITWTGVGGQCTTNPGGGLNLLEVGVVAGCPCLYAAAGVPLVCARNHSPNRGWRASTHVPCAHTCAQVQVVVAGINVAYRKPTMANKVKSPHNHTNAVDGLVATAFMCDLITGCWFWVDLMQDYYLVSGTRGNINRHDTCPQSASAELFENK